MKLDHLTIRTNNLSAAKAFLEQVLDVREGDRPAIIQRIRGHWLYDAEAQPIIHLIESQQRSYGTASEAIDHVGIRPDDDYSSFLRRLRRLEVPYSLMDVAELKERRVFFRVPDGPLLEAVFDAVAPQSNT